MEELSSMKPVPGAKKAGDHWLRGLKGRFGMSLTQRNDLFVQFSKTLSLMLPTCALLGTGSSRLIILMVMVVVMMMIVMVMMMVMVVVVVMMMITMMMVMVMMVMVVMLMITVMMVIVMMMMVVVMMMMTMIAAPHRERTVLQVLC